MHIKIEIPKQREKDSWSYSSSLGRAEKTLTIPINEISLEYKTVTEKRDRRNSETGKYEKVETDAPRCYIYIQRFSKSYEIKEAEYIKIEAYLNKANIIEATEINKKYQESLVNDGHEIKNVRNKKIFNKGDINGLLGLEVGVG